MAAAYERSGKLNLCSRPPAHLFKRLRRRLSIAGRKNILSCCVTSSLQLATTRVCLLQQAVTRSMISFIIPAHNEEELIGRTLRALHETARKVEEAYEVIVASDASSDRTDEIARQHGARVIAVDHRQIAATR